MIKEPLAQCHTVLQVLVRCHQIAPVVLKLQIPPLLLLLRLLLLQIHRRLEVPIDLSLGLIDPLPVILIILLVLSALLITTLNQSAALLLVPVPLRVAIVYLQILLQHLIKIGVVRIRARVSSLHHFLILSTTTTELHVNLLSVFTSFDIFFLRFFLN